MGLQLIFVVETNKKCKSDWIYIKDTIDHFYQYDNAQNKLSCVYMDGKGKYRKKEKEIATLISQYSATSRKNSSKIIYCFDCDDYDVNQSDMEFLRNARQYCTERQYDFVWFCKDIESVYISKKVEDSQKRKEATRFKERNLILNVDANRLEANADTYCENTSNLLHILDKYLARKQR